MTRQTQARSEDASRRTIAEWDLGYLDQRQQDVMEAGDDTIVVEGAVVQDMARRLEQGVGFVALEREVPVAKLMETIDFVVFSPDEYEARERRIGDDVASFRDSARVYVTDEHGIFVSR
jgi:hypothetical protein